MHWAVLIREGVHRRRAVVHRGDVDAALLHQPPAKGHAFRGVMVATDEIDLEPPPGQLDQEVVQQGHCLRRGHRLVVHVPGDEHPLGLLILYNAYNFF